MRSDLMSSGWFEELRGTAPTMKDRLSETRLRSRLKRSWLESQSATIL
jgi:hypothetical protein